MTDQSFHDAASIAIAAGQVPIPVNETLIQLMKTIMTEEQADFMKLFNKPSTREELAEKTDLDDAALDDMLNSLMDNGIITGIPSKSTGQMIYRPLPPIPGIFEYTMMRGETGEKQKTLARLFERIFDELADMVQENYEAVAPMFEAMPPMTRIIPVEKEIDLKFDTVMPYEDVKKVIDRFDTIAVAYCYCRHQKDLLNKPCQMTDERKNCLLFGRTAEFVIAHNFGEQISGDKAKTILEAAEKAGLVHKAFHEKSDTDKEEFAICNCCKCCCETFQIYYRGAGPAATYTSYMAKVDEESCSGCGECVDICPMEAIEMVDDLSRIDESRCIGCGVCAYHCPAEALHLERTGQRKAFVPPPKLETN